MVIPRILRTHSAGALGLGIALLATQGCSTPDPRVAAEGTPEKGRDGTVAFLVQVEASEPDVRIEADGDSIGTAPLTLKIFGDKDGTFHNFGSPEYAIRAYPAKPGQRVQSKIYYTGQWFGREDRIPSKIYFDMNIVSDGTGAAPSR